VGREDSKVKREKAKCKIAGSLRDDFYIILTGKEDWDILVGSAGRVKPARLAGISWLT